MMEIVLFGAAGQVGQALQDTAPIDVQLYPITRGDVDLEDTQAISAALEGMTFDWIMNAAAYTAVDKAESAPNHAQAINGEAVRVMAAAARAKGARFAHLSTDFVFDGLKSTPYQPDDTAAPISVYGATKREGEIAAGPEALIVRTSWVYRAGHANFVSTMLRLLAQKSALSVVADQIGAPTHAASLARTLWALMQRGVSGIYHYSDSGVASWYDFAVAIQEEACALGLLENAIAIVPITTSDYPTPARRPAYSVLNTSKTTQAVAVTPPHWRAELREMLKQVKNHG